jgi:hypothetical protein
MVDRGALHIHPSIATHLAYFMSKSVFVPQLTRSVSFELNCCQSRI